MATGNSCSLFNAILQTYASLLPFPEIRPGHSETEMPVAKIFVNELIRGGAGLLGRGNDDIQWARKYGKLDSHSE